MWLPSFQGQPTGMQSEGSLWGTNGLAQETKNRNYEQAHMALSPLPNPNKSHRGTEIHPRSGNFNVTSASAQLLIKDEGRNMLNPSNSVGKNTIYKTELGSQNSNSNKPRANNLRSPTRADQESDYVPELHVGKQVRNIQSGQINYNNEIQLPEGTNQSSAG
jgi:hypothetical protein